MSTFTETLATLERGTSDAEAGAFFDALPTVRAEEITGRWRGSEVPTAHPLNGLLLSYGWYGKEFIDPDRVHPLLFRTGAGEIFAVDPRKVPMEVAAHLPRSAGSVARRALSLARAVMGTNEPRARLRNVEYRGKVSMAMIYDHLPIIDAFRRVDAGTLLGAMDRRGDDRPLYFVLRREARTV